MDNTHGPLGILGGGQLGRMLALAAHRLGIKTVILDPLGADSPAGMVTRGAVAGHFRDANAVEELAARCKVVTYEIEHINVDALDKIASSQPTLRIEPPPSTLRIIQDKYAQKKHLQSVGGVPMGDFRAVEDEQSVLQAGADWGYPLMLKAKRLAYDGRGNAVVKDRASARAALESLGGGAAGSAELYVERWVPFERELACVVARSSSGQLEAYPVVHTVQKLSMCHTVVTPANSALPRGVHWAAVEAEATRVAQAVVGALPGAGVFGVELFMTADGTVLFNEVAPRVHNSGHYTQDACACDQFEMHVRAVLGLPLGCAALKVPAAAMLNLVGGPADAPGGSIAACLGPIERALSTPRASVHWYGKADAKPQRKMGHINVTGENLDEVMRTLSALEGVAADGGAQPAAPLVGVIMGSDSDLPTMKAAAEILRDFEVPFEVTIVSAHRTPDRLVSYAKEARTRGLQVVIAGAGGAAHLPGMVAAMTPLPVIGVPVKTSTLSGNDSLLSIVQMPRGVPVATVAIGNAANAGLLAVRILGVARPRLLDAMDAYMRAQEAEVLAKADRLESGGWQNYQLG